MKLKSLILVFIGLLLFGKAAAQSPDSRVCNCFTEPVSNDLMLQTQAIYGNVGITLSRDMQLTPNTGQNIRFVFPALPLRSHCQPSYGVAIHDQNNRLVLERTLTTHEFNHTFEGCNSVYHVSLVASGVSEGGGQGNCSRRIHFTVKPRCMLNPNAARPIRINP
ncbi:MAG: hypothetical protein ACK4GN_15280 [Runella sp.]